MAFALRLVLVTSWASISLASRKKYKNDDTLKIQDNVLTSCPDKVAEDPRGECVDANANEIVPSYCCDNLRWCNSRVPEFFDSYAKKMQDYLVNCKLLADDVIQEENGKFRLVDNTRFCSPQCQNFPGLHDDQLPDYAPIESKCADHDLLPKLKAQDNFISIMKDGVSTCTTTSTTNTLPTTLSAASQYFDFTEYFGGAQAKRGASAVLPDYVAYHCCCNPDKNRNSVHCVLKEGWTQSIPEFLRKLIWRGCGGAMGSDYHAWNNVFNKTRTGDNRDEFEGLENRGKCIVRNDELPSFFRGLSQKKIKEYLDNFQNMVK